MTVQAEDSSKRFHGSGNAGPFAWTWRFLANEDISIYRIAVPNEADPSQESRELLVEGEDYTLTGAASYWGGSATLTFNLPVGEDLVVDRNTIPLQKTDFRSRGNFDAEVHEEAFDALTLMIQDRDRVFNDNTVEINGLKPRMTAVEGRATSLEGRATSLEGRATSLEGRATSLEGRAIQVPDGQSAGEMSGTEYASRVGKVLGWNSLGQLALMAMNFVTSSGALANPWADVRGYASLADAVAQLGGLSIDLHVPNVQDVTDDLTIPVNIRLVVPMGGVINVAAGKTLTINGPFSAGLYQVFVGDGVVRFTGASVHAAYPEWFGAAGDWDGVTGTDDTVPIQKTVNAFRTVQFLRCGYKLTDEVLLNPTAMGGAGGWRILGGGNANGVTWGTYLYQATAGKAIFKVGDVAGLVYDQQSYFADLAFTGVSTAIGLWLAITEDTVIERCKFSAMARGIQLSINSNTQVIKPRIYNCRFQGLDYGIINFGTRIGDVWIKFNLFQDNRLTDIHITGEADGGYITFNIFARYDPTVTTASKWLYLQVPVWMHVEHNHFYNSARTGAELTSPRHCSVAHNQFYRSAQMNRAEPALKISSQGSGIIGVDNSYDHNIFYDCYGQAFLIGTNADTDPQIRNNKSYGCGKGLTGAFRIYDAFVFNDLTGAIIEGNRVDGKELGLYVTVSTTAGSTSATLVSQTGGTLVTGMAISGKGIQPNTTVTVSGSSITLSKPATLSVTNQVMTAGNIVTRYGLSLTQTTDCVVKHNISDNCLIVSNFLSGNRRLFSTRNQQPTTYTTTATASADDEVIYVTAAAPWTLTIPSAILFLDKEYLVLKTDNNANVVTLSATINGAASYTSLNAQHKYVRIKSDGTDWRIVGAG